MLVVAISLSFAAALVGICAIGQIARKASVAGVVAHPAGTVSIRARASGQLQESRIVEGARVKRGDLLLVISTEQMSFDEGGALIAAGDVTFDSIHSRGSQLAAERRARIRYYESRLGAAKEKAALLRDQRDHAQSEIEALRQRAELTKSSVARYEALASNGFISATQLQTRQEEMLDASSRLESARRTRLSLLGEEASAAAEIHSLKEQMEIDLAELARSLESNKQDEVQNATRRRIAITAPADGMVSAYQLSTGQAIQQDQFLFDFLPAQVGTSADKPQVHLFASSRTVGFVKPGQLVNLRFDAFPFQKFGMFKGAVATVSRTPFPTSAIPASAFAPQSQQAEVREPMYRILVDLKAGQANADSVLSQLKPGMSVTADVLLEERAIWEWMFEPLIALRRKL